MAEARKMGKTELFAHFVEHFAAVDISLKRADAREFFEELQRVCEQQLRAKLYFPPSSALIRAELPDEHWRGSTEAGVPHHEHCV